MKVDQKQINRNNNSPKKRIQGISFLDFFELPDMHSKLTEDLEFSGGGGGHVKVLSASQSRISIFKLVKIFRT